MDMKVNGIHLTWIVVSNLDEAIKYYSEVVGLTVKTIDKQYGWAELAGPHGSTLGLAQENKEMNQTAGTNAVVTVVVANIQEARDELQKNGTRLLGEIMTIPEEVKLQSFLDKDGNHLQLVELIRGA